MLDLRQGRRCDEMGELVLFPRINKSNAKLGETGFSLIELMVVIVVVSILASIAIPNYERFKKRSRRSEVKLHLAGLFLSEKAFKMEFGEYTADIGLIGYECEGFQRRYTAGFKDSATPFVAGSKADREAGIMHISRTDLNDTQYMAFVPDCGIDPGATTTNIDKDLMPSLPLGAQNSLSFQVGAAGELGSSPDDLYLDTWSIDERKQMINLINGMDE